jgi:hypothetical protein
MLIQWNIQTARNMSLIMELSHNDIIRRFHRSNRSNIAEVSGGALLRAGEFVLYTANASQDDDNSCDGQMAVGQIVCISDLRDIPKDEMGTRFWRTHKHTSGKERFILLRNLPFVDYDASNKERPNAEKYRCVYPSLLRLG